MWQSTNVVSFTEYSVAYVTERCSFLSLMLTNAHASQKKDTDA